MILGLFLDVVKGIRHMTKGTHMNAITSTMRLEVGDEVAVSFFANGTIDRKARVRGVEELERGLYVLDLVYTTPTYQGCGLRATSLADELWQVVNANTAKL